MVAWMVARRDALLLGAALASDPYRLPTSKGLPGVTPAPAWPSQLARATFGVQIYHDDTARRLTLRALEAGFRAFFTSPEAGNQLGFARTIRESGISRGALFIPFSVLSDDATTFTAGRAKTETALGSSLEELDAGGVERLDMLMFERTASSAAAIRGQWRALNDGRRRAGATLLGTSYTTTTLLRYRQYTLTILPRLQ